TLNEKIEKYRDEQDQWKNTILNTQKSYDEVIKNAKKKADKLVFDAQDYAKKLIEAAKTETEHQQDVKKQLATEVEEFKAKLISIYESHVKLISSIPVIKKDSIPFQSDTLEMLKMATSETVTDQYKKEIPLNDENKSIMGNINSKNNEVDFDDESLSVKAEKTDELKQSEKHRDDIHEKIESASSGNSYNDLIYDLKNSGDDEDVKKTYNNFQSRNKKVLNEKDSNKNSRLILSDDDEKENKIRGLFEEDKDSKGSKVKKLFGGKNNKKSLKLFGKANDDDDDEEDDDYYDDDDE
ncbi:MAG: hypothetical protein K0S55_1747, partial [Clostridia bacterium]|nr:hypothetical protein [Clostridia bacterium]